ncbi:DUF2156 domain-containing protein [Marinobacter sp. SS5-14b]|uniref:DUF2156 domain-containing protein n=1 Tax=Marinobacter sp. SS5-14b TaxID=3050456 RepID=UPI0026E05A4C|nr:DUF2156 domain-containing protein [Marinobacter sp. SS5-14b]
MPASNLSVTLARHPAELLDFPGAPEAGQCDPRTSEQLIRQHGSQSSSYFALQPACRHYHSPGLGFVPYVPVSVFGQRVNVVPTRPLASSHAMAALLQEFEQNLPGQPMYVGVDEPVLKPLQSMGYDATMMGTEFSVDLAGFSVRGKAMKQLRHARNLHRRCAVSVVEQQGQDVNWHQEAGVSEAWRERKAVKERELGLLTRPPVFNDEWGVRKFYAYIDDKLAGYVFFDPWFQDGQVAGYCANILRASPEMNRLGVLDHIVLQAMSQFRSEGVPEVSLGIAPLHGVRPWAGDRQGLRWVQHGLYRYGNRLYAFAPLAYHKSRYRGRETPWFVCARNMSSVRVIATLLKGTGLLPIP